MGLESWIGLGGLDGGGYIGLIWERGMSIVFLLICRREEKRREEEVR